MYASKHVASLKHSFPLIQTILTTATSMKYLQNLNKSFPATFISVPWAVLPAKRRYGGLWHTCIRISINDFFKQMIIYV